MSGICLGLDVLLSLQKLKGIILMIIKTDQNYDR